MRYLDASNLANAYVSGESGSVVCRWESIIDRRETLDRLTRSPPFPLRFPQV